MAAFINALREEGTKEDCLAAVERLWDQLAAARLAGKIEGLREARSIATKVQQRQAMRREAEREDTEDWQIYNQGVYVASAIKDGIHARIAELRATATDSASHSYEEKSE